MAAQPALTAAALEEEERQWQAIGQPLKLRCRARRRAAGGRRAPLRGRRPAVAPGIRRPRPRCGFASPATGPCASSPRPRRAAGSFAGPGRRAGWDLSLAVTRLDSFGAMLLWRHWGRRRPDGLVLPAELEGIFGRLAALGDTRIPGRRLSAFDGTPPRWGGWCIGFATICSVSWRWSGQLCLDLFICCVSGATGPLREISGQLLQGRGQAMPVTALVGFLIGVVMSHLSALQLRAFGADVFIVNILGLGIIRELGPVLVAVLVAGRSGSAMTAQIGVMRVTEEIDALTTMGISRYVRLVLPKVVALTLAMPLLTLWGSAVAIFGGMVSGQPATGHGLRVLPSTPAPGGAGGQPGHRAGSRVVFGLLIALVACHFGLRCAQHREPFGQHHGVGGHLDHRGDPGGCGFRHCHPQHQAAAFRWAARPRFRSS